MGRAPPRRRGLQRASAFQSVSRGRAGGINTTSTSRPSGRRTRRTSARTGHVEDVAGKDGVEAIVGVRKRGDRSPTNAVPVVGKRRKAGPGPGDHRGRKVEALAVSLRGGGGEGHQGPARPAADVEHAFAVAHVQPGDPEGPGRARDERHEPVVDRSQCGVEGPQYPWGSTRKHFPTECVDRSTGGEEPGAARNLAGTEVFAR
jgi:hypothetical protein